MKTTISLTQKEPVFPTTELEIMGVYVTVNVNLKRSVFFNKGTDTERLFTEDHVAEHAQATFEGDKITDAAAQSIEELIKKAIAQAQEKFK